MLSKYSVLALIGATAAAPGPIRSTATNNTWPKFTNPITMVSGTGLLATSLAVNPVWLEVVSGQSGGWYRGYRNDVTAFPLQHVTKATDATFANRAKVDTALASGVRAFYLTDKTKLGTMTSTATITGSGGSEADADSWVVCQVDGTNKTQAACNGGISGHTATASGSTTVTAFQIDKRIALKRGMPATGLTGYGNDGSTASNNTTDGFTVNDDLLLITFYHSAGTIATDGTIWCSAWSNALAKAGTEVTITAGNGLGPAGKCTWQLIAEDKTVAPSFTLSSASAGNWELQFIEWVESAALGTNGVIGATDDTTYFTGAYTVSANEVFHNPFTALAAAGSGLKANSQSATLYADPIMWYPGSIGKAIFYPAKEGQWKDTQTVSTDAGVILDRIAYVESIYNAYQTDLNTYNGLKDTYNAAANTEAERLKDFFKATFDPPTLVPTRPCAPSQPAEYTGVQFDFATAVGSSAWKSTATDQGTRAALETAANSGASTTAFHSRYGYLYSTQNNSGTISVTDIGHVFGRFGEGRANLVANSAPFYFGTAASSTLAGMTFSTLPADAAASVLAATDKTVVFKAKATAWATFDSLKLMARPGAAEQPTNVLNGAKALIATGLASAAVLATIA